MRSALNARSMLAVMVGPWVASLFAACLPHDDTSGPLDGAPGAPTIDASVFPPSSSSGGGSGGGGSSSSGVTSPPPLAPCKPGFYQGTMTGSYFSGGDSGSPV